MYDDKHILSMNYAIIHRRSTVIIIKSEMYMAGMFRGLFGDEQKIRIKHEYTIYNMHVHRNICKNALSSMSGR